MNRFCRAEAVLEFRDRSWEPLRRSPGPPTPNRRGTFSLGGTPPTSLAEEEEQERRTPVPSRTELPADQLSLDLLLPICLGHLGLAEDGPVLAESLKDRLF